MNILHTEAVEETMPALILRLMKDEKLKDFVLAGGAALSLQIGHRMAGEVEMITKNPWMVADLYKYLSVAYKAENIKTEKEGFSGKIDGIKVGLLSYPYPQVESPVIIDGIRMLSLDDLGAMTLKEIVENGSRFEDYVDLYKLLEEKSLEELAEAYERKYPKVNRSAVYKKLMPQEGLVPETLHFVGHPVTVGDLAYRFKKALKEPKRIFELVIWQRQPPKKKKGAGPSVDKSRGRGLHE